MEKSKFKIQFDTFRLVLLACFIVIWTLKRVVIFEFLVNSHVIHYAFAAFSVLLLLFDLFTERRLLKGKNVFLLIGLCVVAIFSTFVNKYSVVENLSTILFVGVQFLLFYSCPSGQRIERVKKDLMFLSKVFCYLFSLFTTIQVLTYIFNLFYDIIEIETGFVTAQGYNIWLGRTWGVFYYPSALVLAIVAIGLIVYLLHNKGINKGVAIYCIIINYLGIVLCGARSVQYAFYVFVFCLAFLTLNKKLYAKFMAAVLSLVIIFTTTSLVSHLLPYVQNAVYNSISPKYYSKVLTGMEKVYGLSGYRVQGYFVNEEVDSTTGKKISKQGLAKLQDIERYDLAETEDTSNSRTSIWSEGIQIFKENLLLGVSPRGVVAYAEENYPTSLIATWDWPLHNSYLDIPVQTGILGCIFFCGFVFALLVYYANYFVRFRKHLNRDILVLFPIILAMCVYLLVESDVFLQYTAQAMMFWLILGTISALVKNEMEEEHEEVPNT